MSGPDVKISVGNRKFAKINIGNYGHFDLNNL